MASIPALTPLTRSRRNREAIRAPEKLAFLLNPNDNSLVSVQNRIVRRPGRAEQLFGESQLHVFVSEIIEGGLKAEIARRGQPIIVELNQNQSIVAPPNAVAMWRRFSVHDS